MNEILLLVGIGLLAAMSPGPDMILVVKNSLSKGQKEGVLTGVGIGLGILVHVTYCIAGVALIISQSIIAYSVIKWLGALYLFYIAFLLLKSGKPTENTREVRTDENIGGEVRDRYTYLREGFVCNVLNPKATLFYLALFTQVIDNSATLSFKIGIGILLAVITGSRFIFLASTVGHTFIRSKVSKTQYYLEKLFGILLIVLSIKVITTK